MLPFAFRLPTGIFLTDMILERDDRGLGAIALEKPPTHVSPTTRLQSLKNIDIHIISTKKPFG